MTFNKIISKTTDLVTIMSLDWAVYLTELDVLIKSATSLILMYVAISRLIDEKKTRKEKQEILEELAEDLKDINKTKKDEE